MNTIKQHNILVDILLTIITLGFFNLWIQLRQISDINELLGEDEFSFFWTIVWSIFTFGLYFCYHEYKMTLKVQKIALGHESKDIAILCALGSFLGLWFFVDSYQQHMINEFLSKQV